MAEDIVRRAGGRCGSTENIVRKRGGTVRNGRGRLRERWRGAAGWWRGNRKKVERGYGSAEDIVQRGREGVWRDGAE